MPWTVSNISLKQQHRGPIWNGIVSVAAEEEYLVRTSNVTDNKQSDIFTVDNKVTVFFKFKLNLSGGKLLSLTPYVTIRKIESVQNCNVEINCQKYRKVISCSEEYIEVKLNPIEGGGWLPICNIEVNITVHDMSMSIHTQLYGDTEFTDFQLKAADGAVAVHKAILAFQSDMFKTMLKGEWKETVEGCINIDGVTIQTLQHLKDYMYLGTLPDEGLEPLILLAEHYLMDKLKSDCITRLVKSVKPENFDRIIKFACHGGMSEELVSALIFGIPDNVANSVYPIYQFNKNKTEPNEEK